MRLLVATEQLLDSRARARSAAPGAAGSSGSSSMPSSSAARASAKWPVAACGAGECGQQLDPLLRRRGLAEQPQGRREPARRARRRALRGLLACLAEDRDGVAVALRGGALEVVRARRRRLRRARRVRRRSADARRGASRRARPRRPPGGRAGAGSGSGAGRRWGGRGRGAAARRARRPPPPRRRPPRPPSARARTGRRRPPLLRGIRRASPESSAELLGERRGHRGRHLDAADRTCSRLTAAAAAPSSERASCSR